MADEQHEFRVLMEGVRAGDDDAARELLTRYGDAILGVIRRRLSKKLRPKFDSADFAQAVWASFFAAAPTRPDSTFEHPRALVAFLSTLAQNKVLEAVRQRLHYKKYNVDRERPLDRSAAALRSDQPTPSAVAAAEDEWRRLLRDLPEQYCRILGLLRAGHTPAEAAEEVGICERTVRRLLQRLSGESVA